MTSKFYGYLWVLFAVSAGVLWLGNVFTMMTAVVFGFTAFGLVFTGMMCVLPGLVSHPATSRVKTKEPAAVAALVPSSPAAAKTFTYRPV